MATATMRTTIRVATTTEEIVAPKVWARPSSKTIVKNANAWTRTPRRRLHLPVESRNTKAMATATMRTTIRVATTTAEIVVPKVWARPSSKTIVKNANAWTRNPRRRLHLPVESRNTKAMATATMRTTIRVATTTAEI